MSTELLVAILGKEAVDSMPAERLAGLVRQLDSAILEDPALMGRLTSAVDRAMSRSTVPSDATPEAATPLPG